jgi:3-oxoadipate enol-lactonase
MIQSSSELWFPSESVDPAGTVVLVPGLDGTALLFYRQIPRLQARFHVLLNPLPDDPRCTMADLVDQICGSVAAHARGDVLLCGESFGGALALRTALRGPAWLRGLVLVNSFARVPSQWRLRLAIGALRVVPWAAMPFARRFTEHRLHSRRTHAEDLRVFRACARKIGRAGYVRRLELLRGYDVRDQLGSIGMPVLLLAADQDRLLPSLSEAHSMAARLPQPTLRVLEGYGHVCLIDGELDLLELVAPWFEGVRDVGPAQADRR